jgi:hypothetical protein
MKGRLSLRSHFAMQRLEYNGGGIDPGYRGYLFFTLANLGDAPVEISYDDALVTVEFIRLGKAAKRAYNDGKEILKLEDRQQLPKFPPLPKEQYDPIELSERVQKIEDQILKIEGALERFQPALRVTEEIVQSLILASVAGIIAGLVLVIVPNLSEYPTNYLYLGLFFILFSVLLAAFFRRRKNR